MAKNRVLEAIIHNSAKFLIPSICGYLQELRFLHAPRMLKGCKLDPIHINALLERWRPKTHTFHLPYGECTITLEDVALQLGLPVIKGAAIILGKEDLCATLLGKVPNKFDGGWISMNWLVKKFDKLSVDAIEVVKEQYTRAFILLLIGGILMPNKS
ncbi:hypothetical protein PVK06_024396 [Gossypium arboreum]|uniref:Aminotransferase-like plant mobile domain-containing protein n=1 Tax=Gossypium arboreum TaxID=29729 RepID=A0ABR0PDX5_GOSAR|nr:hypothetical protein PVK06_024396 [Gossypium arboreum]